MVTLGRSKIQVLKLVTFGSVTAYIKLSLCSPAYLGYNCSPKQQLTTVFSSSFDKWDNPHDLLVGFEPELSFWFPLDISICKPQSICKTTGELLILLILVSFLVLIPGWSPGGGLQSLYLSLCFSVLFLQSCLFCLCTRLYLLNTWFTSLSWVA